MTSSQVNTGKIKSHALQLGFDACGVSRAEYLDQDAQQLAKWLGAGYQADMNYMSINPEKRSDPRKLVPGAQSVISVFLNYYPAGAATDAETPKISCYADSLVKLIQHFWSGSHDKPYI